MIQDEIDKWSTKMLETLEMGLKKSRKRLKTYKIKLEGGNMDKRESDFRENQDREFTAFEDGHKRTNVALILGELVQKGHEINDCRYKYYREITEADGNEVIGLIERLLANLREVSEDV
jgi:hypothetical protein